MTADRGLRSCLIVVHSRANEQFVYLNCTVGIGASSSLGREPLTVFLVNLNPLGGPGAFLAPKPRNLRLGTFRIMDDPQRKWLLLAVLYIIALAIGAAISLRTVHWDILVIVLLVGYPLWFVVWLASFLWALFRLGRLYRQTSMEMWGWFSVPHSVAFPALALVFRLSGGEIVHLFGFHLLFACLTVPSSVLWAFTTLLLVARQKTATASTKVMLGMTLLGVPLWIILNSRS